MRFYQRAIVVETTGRGLYDATGRVADIVSDSMVSTGLCHVFLQHTSASLVIQENADGNVILDLLDWFERQVPDGDPRYRHVDEGPDDMSGHIRSALTATSLTIPVEDHRLALGTWQAIYLFEHRTAPHARRMVVTIQGV